MTDTYSADSFDNVVKWHINQQRRAPLQAMQDLEADPDKSARAIQLGEATGTPAAVVDLDVDAHAMEMRRQSTFQILVENAALRNWVDQNPMASKIAADDWHNLDDFTKKLEKATWLGSWGRAEARVSHQFVEGFAESFQGIPNRSAELLDMPSRLNEMVPEEYQQAAKNLWAGSIGGVAYWPARGVELGLELLFRGIGGTVGGTIKASEQVLKELGVEDSTARRIAREAHGFAEFAMAAPLHLAGTGATGAGVRARHAELVRPVSAEEIKLAQHMEAARLAKPFVEAGEDVPIGLHPIWDKILADRAKYDREILDGIEQSADKSNVRERSPKEFADLTKLVKELEVEIDPAAALRLYGDKPPGPGDGILGDRAPNIAQQLADALEHEEKVKLPLEQYLLLDKELRTALKDDVVSRKNGLTVNEAKGIPEPPPDFKPFGQLYPDGTDAGKFRDALNSHRKATKSDPLFVREAQELHLQSRADLPQPGMEGTHGFDIVDEMGRQVAELQLTPSGKDIKIEWLGGTITPALRPNQISNIFGPALVRGLFQQIRDAFPEAETISGKRVSGAREGTPKSHENVKIDIEALRQEFPESASRLPEHEATKAEYEKFWDMVHSGEWTKFNKFLEAQIVPTAEMTAKEAGIYAEIDQILSRVAPGIQHLPARGIAQEGVLTQAAYQPFMDKAPVIIWSLHALDPRVAGRHEAIHWLRQYNIIKPGEWDTLVKAAIDNDWIGKHKIEETYRGEPLVTKLEEAIAQEFGEWGAKRAKDHATSGIFQKMMQVAVRVKNAIFRAFGREVTAQELFQKIESGEVGQRGPQAPSPGRPGEPTPFDMEAIPEAAQPTAGILPMAAKIPKQMELPIRRAEEMPPIEPGAIMPAARQQQYLKKWDEQRAAEQGAIDKIIERDVQLREDKRWKDRSVELLKDVEDKIRQQPEFLISNFFRRGVFYGDKVKDFMPKIDPKYLTPEQKAEFPKAWLKKDGFAPDEVAPLFKIDSGDEFLSRIAEFERTKGDMQPAQFFDFMVGKELERQLEAEFGKKEDVIMAEVRDHQFGGRNWDLYHEDTMAMAMQAGHEPPLSKGEFRQGVQASFSQKLMKHISWPAVERMMYSAGGKLENAILGGDFAQAYRFAQAKEKAHLFGMELKGLVSDLKNFNKVAGKYGKREPVNVDPETTNFVHQILNQIGETTRRSDADIAREIQKSAYADLRDFVDKRRADGWDVYMPEFLLDGTWKKSVEDMSVEEFRGVHDALKSMDAMSRKLKSTEVAGVLWEHEALIDRMVDTLRDLPTKAEDIRLDLPEGPMKDLLKRAWASSIQLEAMFNRFDQGNPLGIFNQAIVRKYATAANYQAAYDKRMGRILKEIEAQYPIKQANKTVFQEFFKDPSTGEYLQMSRMNVLAVLANVGNPGNLYGLMDGWKIPRARANELMDWVRNNTYKEDWLRQQAIGEKIWNVLKDENDNMRRELSGVAPPRIDMWEQPITGPRGEKFNGWYFPIIYDRRFPQKNPDMAGKSLTEYPYWIKQLMPGAPFAKQRTGYVGPYLLEFDSFAGRMQSMVRDTVWRPVLTDLQKIFRDDKFKSALSRHYGKQYTALLEPFLQDIAGNQKLIDDNAGAGLKAIQFLRQNVISHLVGFNPYTIAKHDLTALVQSITEVGAKEFGKAFLSMITDRDANSMGSFSFAMSKSEELQRRRKNYYENISGSFDRTFGDLMFSRELKDTFDTFKERPVGEAARIVKGEMQARYMRMRDVMHYVEAAPLATLDLLSAVPTWTAKYRQAIVAGHNEGQAMFLADRAVRRAHGSTVITNRPSVMRTNPFVASFVSFYAFFNHILMRQYEVAWATRAALQGQGYFVREPIVDRATMETEPLLVQRGRKDLAEARAEEYKKTDAYKQGAHLIAPMSMMLLSYFIVPAWIEEIVSPHTTPQEAKRAKRGFGPIEGPKKDQMWASYIAQVELTGLSGSWLGARDIVHAAMHGGDVGAGVLGEGSREILKLVTQGKKGLPKTLEEKQKLLRSTNGLFNILTGIGAPNSVPRAALFGANWYTGKEKPQGFRDFWHGIGHGTLKEHK